MMKTNDGRVASPPGSCPSDQAASHPAPSGFDPSRKLMQVELRPFHSRKAPGLDEIVADNVGVFHAEMMSETSLWIGLSDSDDGLLHVHIGIEKHRGRYVLAMYAYDQDRPTIVPELDRLKAYRLASEDAASAMEAAEGGRDPSGLDPKDDSAVLEEETPSPIPAPLPMED